LPAGFHRIRYYDLLASPSRAGNIVRAHKLLAPPILPLDAIKAASSNLNEPQASTLPLLRRSHDHHRAVPTRRNSALPTELANASDQDRHIMACPSDRQASIAGYFVAAPTRHASARANIPRATNHRLTFARSVPRQASQHAACTLHTQQSPRFPTRPAMHPARSVLKSS